jgi:flagellin
MSIAAVDAAMQRVAAYRADLGASQNRLQYADKALGIHIESLSAARSRITDVDFASETANLTQQKILQQAGASVLTHANQLPEIALKLLNSD